LKTAREELDIINAFEETGSLRAAAALCGTTHKTVKRVLERRAAGRRSGRRRAPLLGLAYPFADLVLGKVKSTDGRITAKRLLPIVRAAGYTGSARTLRRAVAVQKARWKRLRRVYRPWTPEPGQHLLIDYGTVTHGPNAGLKIFTAVLAWSRWRFVRFTREETLETTLRLLAECFEAAGGVPAVVGPWPPRSSLAPSHRGAAQSRLASAALMDQWSYAITFVDSAADGGCACGSGEGQQALPYAGEQRLGAAGRGAVRITHLGRDAVVGEQDAMTPRCGVRATC
jgi:hypothetical protein